MALPVAGYGGKEGEDNQDQQAEPPGGFPAEGTDGRIKEGNKAEQDGISRKVPVGQAQHGKECLDHSLKAYTARHEPFK